MAVRPGARSGRLAGFLIALLMAALLRTEAAAADLFFQTLYEFGLNPKNPRAGLVQGSDGNFYGTTAFGGTNGESGTVFQFTPSGQFRVLHSFQGSEGALPWAGLVPGNDGNLYGTTERGGTNGEFGTVYQITTSGEFTVLHHFDGVDGRFPQATLAQGTDTNFYGTTALGGTNSDNGTVFRITPGGVFSSLFSFNGTNGSRPLAGLIQGRDGNFYGTTSGGGPDYDGTSVFGNGTVFQLTPDGKLTSLFFFKGTNGSDPEGSLVEGSDGNFYGTTQSGGAYNDNGTVFKITSAGELSTLYSFSGPDGNYPVAGLIRDNAGNLFGTTSGDAPHTFGTAFQMTPGGALATLFSFNGTNGASPVGGLFAANDGNFYGTTFEGGAGGGGTLFRLAQPPLIAAVSASDGNATLTWTSFTNGTYRVEYKPALTDPSWSALDADIIATGNQTSTTTSLASGTQRFYRIRLLP